MCCVAFVVVVLATAFAAAAAATLRKRWFLREEIKNLETKSIFSYFFQSIDCIETSSGCIRTNINFALDLASSFQFQNLSVNLSKNSEKRTAEQNAYLIREDWFGFFSVYMAAWILTFC